MNVYQSKYSTLSGTSYREMYRAANTIYDRIKRKSKRKPYVRSAYFNKQKIFIDYFWPHLWKSGGYKERVRRLKYYKASIDLIRYTRNNPTTKENPNNKKEVLHRFAGVTKDKKHFYVQIKEIKRNGTKYFISCFPYKSRK